MTVEVLLQILQKNVKKCDRANAQVEIWHKDQEFELEGIHGWGLSPDIAFHIKPTTSPMMKPATFKKEHTKMVKAKLKEIKKSLKGK